MSEILVVSDADLEEGEIVDDVEIEVVEIKPKLKHKKLPRRYVLHEKNEKIRRSGHHRQSSHHKKHHKCSHHLERKKLGSKPNSIKSSSSHSNQRESPIASLTLQKSAFKNFSSPRRDPIKLKNHGSECKPLKEDPLLQIPLPVATHEELKGNEGQTLVDISKECSSQVINSLSTDRETSKQSVRQDERKTVNNTEEEDEEDEEELRRIALAACLKVPVINHVQNPEQFTGSTAAVNYVQNDKKASSKTSNALQSNCDIYLPGNNEVVDMELDSDCSTEDVKSDLFVIDKNPLSSNLYQGHPEHKLNQHPAEPHQKINEPIQEFYLDNSQNHSIDEIEEARLRAEVIASMLSAKPRGKEFPVKQMPLLSVKNPNKILPPARNNNVTSVLNRKVVRSHPFYKHPSSNFLNITRKRVVNKAKLNYLKSLTPKKSLLPQVPQRRINAVPGRLVITLNNDSSSEESDEENDQKKEIEDASLASIEALISDARQRSDCLKSTDTNNVSCLSKAQQEEYSNLKKILAEKQVLSKKTAVDIDRKRALQLKILSKKVSVAQSNLKKEKSLLTSVEKELLEKKQEYMTSKLKVQLLKEQLHAAELIRAANLDSWKKTSAKLDIQKKSVTKHEAIVDLLEKKLSDKQLPQENMILSSNNQLHLPS